MKNFSIYNLKRCNALNTENNNSKNLPLKNDQKTETNCNTNQKAEVKTPLCSGAEIINKKSTSNFYVKYLKKHKEHISKLNKK